MADVKFWLCKHCGNLFYTIDDGHVTPKCCGEDMVLLNADAADGAGEKHVPVVTIDRHKIVVNVGEIDHPMLEEHSIQWIAVVDDEGDIQIKRLHPGDAPSKAFCGKHIEKGTVYAYCNLHGLWKTEFSK